MGKVLSVFFALVLAFAVGCSKDEVRGGGGGGGAGSSAVASTFDKMLGAKSTVEAQKIADAEVDKKLAWAMLELNSISLPDDDRETAQAQIEEKAMETKRTVKEIMLDNKSEEDLVAAMHSLNVGLEMMDKQVAAFKLID